MAEISNKKTVPMAASSIAHNNNGDAQLATNALPGQDE